MEVAPLLGDFAEWFAVELAREATPSLTLLLQRFCDGLAARGLPIWRCSLGLETLHPQTGGVLTVWQEGALETMKTERAGIDDSPDYRDSPMRVIDETDRPFRRRLLEGDPGMPLLRRLRSEGATDYAIFPLPVQDKQRSAAVSFATRAPAGFDEHQLEQLERASLLIGPQAERIMVRSLAINLLDIYLGHRVGELIYAGRIDRGDVSRGELAIWFCDLRDYTELSNILPAAKTVELLDGWFELMGEAVSAEGGEILKFLGDGFLAAFNASEDRQEGCRRALAAARRALAAADAEQASLSALAGRPVGFGLALHVGAVDIGNVGTHRRLDFTILGPAVNLTSRLQALTRPLGRRLLASADFLAALGERTRAEPLGDHPIRGFPDPVAIYALD